MNKINSVQTKTEYISTYVSELSEEIDFKNNDITDEKVRYFQELLKEKNESFILYHRFEVPNEIYPVDLAKIEFSYIADGIWIISITRMENEEIDKLYFLSDISKEQLKESFRWINIYD
jgi:hypothetical protein